jgi:hypothetical protein
MIHFHANGEDLSQTIPLIERLNFAFKLTIIVVEYPGYGIYEEIPKDAKETKKAR